MKSKNKKMQKFKKKKIIYSFVSEIKINELVDFIHICLKKKTKKKYICLTNVHSISESFKNSSFRKVQNLADLSLPDGRPIYWVLKLLGSKNAEHLPGYFVTEKLCELADKKKLNIGFYGSTDDNLNKIKINLRNKFKKLKIKYTYSPPFRPLTHVEDKKIITQINKLKIDILFVCLGCPKQELWMYKQRNKLNCTMLGIGAVADFLSGNKILPNKFFEYLGLAWFIRLITEPRRLFWRYFSTNFLFILLIFLQITGLKKFK